MDQIVMLGVRMSKAERDAAFITARRQGTSIQEFLRSLLSENQLFRRELTRMKRESGERELVSV